MIAAGSVCEATTAPSGVQKALTGGTSRRRCGHLCHEAQAGVAVSLARSDVDEAGGGICMPAIDRTRGIAGKAPNRCAHRSRVARARFDGGAVFQMRTRHRELKLQAINLSKESAIVDFLDCL